ncbi:MAG: Tritrans,polycis-undecaprenyl-diphosphate synthase (GGDP specific) [Candidatus Woesearchaeota archaeon]|nr:Tritrans,polycis-undecaprenyl-diphosphate synthase (GGDP specific) [Candidatus Woesearchaeota archaeon]
MKPKHIAISFEKDIFSWAEHNNRKPKEILEKRIKLLKDVFLQQVDENIPILTVFLLKSSQDSKNFGIIIDSLVDFFSVLAKDEFLLENQIKVSVFGKWYNLPNRLVDIIKCSMDQTKHFDKFFLNFCINYDGQEEIADACRLIARKVQSGKIDPDSINKSLIKENIYTSYFIAPDLLIINGSKKTQGFLLWDLSNTRIYFTNKHWPDFTKRDFEKALDLFKLIS